MEHSVSVKDPPPPFPQSGVAIKVPTMTLVDLYPGLPLVT